MEASGRWNDGRGAALREAAIAPSTRITARAFWQPAPFDWQTGKPRPSWMDQAPALTKPHHGRAMPGVSATPCARVRRARRRSPAAPAPPVARAAHR